MARRTRDEAVHTITHAPRPHSDDMDFRITRYLISMAVRTVCVVMCFVVPWPWRWGFAAGAIFLPYFAVVMANAGYTRRTVRRPPPDSFASDAAEQGRVIVPDAAMASGSTEATPPTAG